jgi:glycine/D-amino acid oxidase-like deaminating enzyme
VSGPYDLAVVGLGPVGAAAVRHAARRGARVVGVGPGEPADLASHRGVFASHYDSGRITRHLDRRFVWAELARRAIAEYPVIEAGGEPFHRPVGVIYAVHDATAAAELREVALRLAPAGVLWRETVGSPDERVDLHPDATVFVEGPPAGHLDPRRLVRAQLTAGRSLGAHVIDAEVEGFERRGRSWSLRLRDGREVDAARVLIATGPHADEIAGVARRPTVEVVAETVVVAALDIDECRRLDGLPSVIAPTGHPVYDGCYLVPPTPYPDGTRCIKLGAEHRQAHVLATAADRRAWMRGADHTAELPGLLEVLHSLVPGLRPVRAGTKPCLLATTRSGLPVIDHVDDDVVTVAGCNGYAAKSSDALGSLGVSLVLEGRWTDAVLDHESFRLGAG